MSESVVRAQYDDDELEVEDLEDAAGGIVAPLEDVNSSCTINGNCGCAAA